MVSVSRNENLLLYFILLQFEEWKNENSDTIREKIRTRWRTGFAAKALKELVEHHEQLFTEDEMKRLKETRTGENGKRMQELERERIIKKNLKLLDRVPNDQKIKFPTSTVERNGYEEYIVPIDHKERNDDYYDAVRKQLASLDN